ncbi:hypothetical protein DRP05_09475 [Archaeoglobales archaeon]|nr:MAG: hypothetical protein DRP05_09475 [Archaeoglobales archaeon]
MEYLLDYITEREVLDTPKERVRQKVEKYLVEKKGYPKENIIVDYSFLVEIDNKKFLANIDLLVKVNEINFMNIECAPPTVLSALERKALACSRIFKPAIPYTVLTDWKQTKVFESVGGKLIGEDFYTIPSFGEARKIVDKLKPVYFDEKRIEREKRILFAFMGVLHCKCEVFED